MKMIIRSGLFVIGMVLLTKGYSQNVRFEAGFTSETEIPVPRTYVKIYEYPTNVLLDSLFADNEGEISHIVPYTFNAGTAIKNCNLHNLISRPHFPKQISRDCKNYVIEYEYPYRANLFFFNVQGKQFPNHSFLVEGIYFYQLNFADGSKSDVFKTIVVEACEVSVELENKFIPIKRTSFKNTYHEQDIIELFCAEFVKDGYVTHRDTIRVDTNLIKKDYTLTAAPSPTASFIVSGTQQVGEAVVFDGVGSLGANSEELVYSWDFGNGKHGQGISIPHLYNMPGTYNVTLTVAGDYGATHSSTQTVTIVSGPSAETNNGVVTGFVTDEALFELEGATIALSEGPISGISDSDGKIVLSNLPVGIPIHLTISKTGYVKQVIELTIPADDENALFYSTLKSRGITTTLANAEYGGKVDGAGGASVELPIDALVTQDGSVATGDVNVSITPVDVVNETHAFPGTFNAFNTVGDDGVLLSYGVSDFTFEQGTEQLQLAEGKTATILVPIYTSGATLGDEIDLWSVNEDNGTWVQEGTGIVVESDESPSGLALKATVGHFSWWNCDDFDDDEEKSGKCFLYEYYHGICHKVPVGCWVKGAQREPRGGMLPNSKLKGTNDEVYPVFEVRDYLSAEGKLLKFPSTRDVYVEARAAGTDGNILVGSTVIIAADTSTTFEIELKTEQIQTGDTVDLTINTSIDSYLEPNGTINFRVDVPEAGVYGLYIDEGVSPSFVNGFFEVKKEKVIITSGTIENAYPAYVFTDAGEHFITLTGENSTENGNFTIGLFDIPTTTISFSESISDTLRIGGASNMYAFETGNDTLLSFSFNKTSGNSHTYFKLYSQSGTILSSEKIFYNAAETVFLLPVNSGSTYFIEISSYEVSYQFTLDTISSRVLDYNSLTEVDVQVQTDSYYEVVVPDNKITSFSFSSDQSSGEYTIWTEQCEKLTAGSINHPAYTYYEMVSFIDTLAPGKYYIRIKNNDALKYYINIHEAVEVSFGDKGEAVIGDSFDQQNDINVYWFSGAVGDAVHIIAKIVDGLPEPEGVELACYKIGFIDNLLEYEGLHSHTLDSTILGELAGCLDPGLSGEEAIWVFAAGASTSGAYELNFHYVEKSTNIIVDDDFAQYSDATTSSLVAAGYAIADQGEILVANGEYLSYLEVTIKSESVEFTGQSKENVVICCNESETRYNPNIATGIYFQSWGGSLSNFSIGCVEDFANEIYLGGNHAEADRLNVENIDFVPYGHSGKGYGEINGYGDNMRLKNIKIDTSDNGVSLAGDNITIENCTITSIISAIECTGNNNTIKNNTIVLSAGATAIQTSVSYSGNHVIDSNKIFLNGTTSNDYAITTGASSNSATDTNIAYVRYNTIMSSAKNAGAISADIGNAPSKVIIENNVFKCSNEEGGRALFLDGRTSASSIIVRNNVFDGLSGTSDIIADYVDKIVEGQQFAILNNSFRGAFGSLASGESSMVDMRIRSSFSDTASVYFYNNIFEGNGLGHFAIFEEDFLIYSDYNVVFNFGGYINDAGTLIGTTNDKTTDPLFIDDDLRIGAGSSAIDNGASPGIHPLVPLVDVEGTSRPLGSGYDIGAYEH